MRSPSPDRWFLVRRWRLSAPWTLLLVGCLAQSSAVAQQPTQTDTGTKQKAPAQATPPKSTATDNPFPADVSEKAAEQKQKEEQPAAPDAPDAGQAAPSPKPGTSATDNPFPEDVSRRAAAEKSAADAANGSGISSSGSSSSNPDAGANTDATPDVPRESGRRKLRKPSRNDIESGSLAGEGTAKDDTRVGNYYLSDHNYQGAYNRFAEAVRLDPGNVEAIYGLAESASNLHRTDEAVNDYKLYLAVAPDGGHAKSAQRALRELAK